VLVPHSALQLAPGCVPPPAAFFLVEQLLRDKATPTILSLAIQLLRGSVMVVTPGQGQQQRLEQQSSSTVDNASTTAAAGSAELARRAYCSLAATVLQAVMRQQQQGEEQQQQQQGQLGEVCMGELLALAAELVQAAGMAPTLSTNGSAGSADNSKECSGDNSGSMEAHASHSTSSISTSRAAASWGLAASLAAAVAACAYNAHQKQLQAADAGGQAQQLHGRAPAGEEAEGGGSNMQPGAAVNSSSTTSGHIEPTGGSNISSSSSSAAAAGAVGCELPAATPEGACPCPAECSSCSAATRLFLTFNCLERGVMLPSGCNGNGALAAVCERLVEAGQGPLLPQLLERQLLALAWRHPVPGVCGNVLCEQLEGPSAAGAVRGCCSGVRTLCGRCRAAWYCCEGCQREAWPAHSMVCRGRY
jgi:hypothetical protein